MARNTRTIKSARRRYLKIGLKNLNTSLKVSEKLLKTTVVYKKSVSGSVITAQTIGMAVGISILEAVLPAVITETKKLIAKQKRKILR